MGAGMPMKGMRNEYARFHEGDGRVGCVLGTGRWVESVQCGLERFRGELTASLAELSHMTEHLYRRIAERLVICWPGICHFSSSLGSPRSLPLLELLSMLHQRGVVVLQYCSSR